MPWNSVNDYCEGEINAAEASEEQAGLVGFVVRLYATQLFSGKSCFLLPSFAPRCLDSRNYHKDLARFDQKSYKNYETSMLRQTQVEPFAIEQLAGKTLEKW